MAGRNRRNAFRGSDDSSTVTVDETLRLLANPTCRTLLYQLVTDPSNTARIVELVETCAEQMDKDRETVALECHHAHFPILQEAGVIDYDEQSGDVRYYGNPLIEAVLDAITPWEK